MKVQAARTMSTFSARWCLGLVLGIGLAAGTCLAANVVTLPERYLAAGEHMKGVVSLEVPAGLAPDAVVRVVAERETSVPDAKGQAGAQVQELVSKPAGAQGGSLEVPFEMNAEGCCSVRSWCARKFWRKRTVRPWFPSPAPPSKSACAAT